MVLLMKIFELGGIDQKSNPLTLQDNKLIDARNIQLDTNRFYIKRKGYTGAITLDPGEEFADAVYFKSKNQIVAFVTFDGGGVFGYSVNVYDGTTFAFIRSIYGSSTGLTRSVITVESDEYLDDLYFIMTIDGFQSVVFKTDGYYTYTAGLPTPIASGFSVGATYYWRVFWRTRDLNGNIVYSPYEQFSTNTLVTSYTVQQLTTQAFAGYGQYLDLLSGTPQTINQSNPTITNVGHNLNAGQFVFISSDDCVIGGIVINQPTNRTFILLEVLSTTGSTVTFTNASLDGVDITFTYVVPSGRQPLDGRQSLVTAISTNANAGYMIYAQTNFTAKNGISTPVTAQPIAFSTSNAWNNTRILLEDVYDTSTSKLRPPLCKYIKAFGDQLVYGNIIGLWDQNNVFTQINNNDIIFYSDISTGDSGENISAVNRQKIGESYDGQVTGLTRSRDSLIVGKDRSLWSLDGVLVPGEFALRKIETNYIGCLSNKSFLQIQSGFLFQGNDGIYISNGFKAEKFTDSLDPFFSAIDKTLTKSAIDVSQDKYLFYVTDGISNYIIAYDWHWNEWFIWDSLNCESGLINTNEDKVLFFNNSNCYVFDDARNDNGLAIDAWLKTKFFDNGEPGLINKFTELRIYNLNNVNFTLEVEQFKDWSTTGSGQTKTFTFSGKNSRMNCLPIANNNSVSLKMRNNVLDENICISGYEFAVKDWGVMDKTR